MADPRFFNKERNFKLGEIAKITGCQLIGASGSEDLLLEDISSLKNADNVHLTFFDNIKYKDDFLSTNAAACFVSSDMVDMAPKGLACLVSDNPYKSYAIAANIFYPENKPEGYISKSAYIDSLAQVGDNATIAHNVVIEGNATIGKNAWIESGAIIKENVVIGDNCHIGSNSVISHSIIGDYVHIYSGACIGQDGFGFAIDPSGHVKVPQLGRVIIEDHVEIGACTTIDRGAGPDTIIGQGTWIDNLVQIAHNVRIGKGCVIVAQVGISGSTILDDYVVVGGQAGIAGHLQISTGVRIGAQSGVMSDIKTPGEYLGSPVFPKTQFFRQLAVLNRLIKKRKNA